MEQFNILVCDDDKSIVDAIEIYLKQEGYHVIKAYNGLEALQALDTGFLKPPVWVDSSAVGRMQVS